MGVMGCNMDTKTHEMLSLMSKAIAQNPKQNEINNKKMLRPSYINVYHNFHISNNYMVNKLCIICKANMTL